MIERADLENGTISRKVLISREKSLEDQILNQVIGEVNLEEHIREILMREEVFLGIRRMEQEVQQEIQTCQILEEIIVKSQG